MAKTSSVEKYKRNLKLISRYKDKRLKLKELIRNPATGAEERANAQRELAELPRASLPVRLRRRCQITGRTRGNYQRFELCRHKFRELAHKGCLPGISKASW